MFCFAEFSGEKMENDKIEECRKELDIIVSHLECVPDLVSGIVGGYFQTKLELRKY